MLQRFLRKWRRRTYPVHTHPGRPCHRRPYLWFAGKIYCFRACVCALRLGVRALIHRNTCPLTNITPTTDTKLLLPGRVPQRLLLRSPLCAYRPLALVQPGENVRALLVVAFDCLVWPSCVLPAFRAGCNACNHCERTAGLRTRTQLVYAHRSNGRRAFSPYTFECKSGLESCSVFWYVV